MGVISVKSKVECTQAINRCKTKDGEQGKEQGSSHGTETQRNWISPELLEAIESVPYHEYFIHMHVGVLPRGQEVDTWTKGLHKQKYSLHKERLL